MRVVSCFRDADIRMFNSLQQILNDKFMWDGKRLAILTRFTIEEVCFKKKLIINTVSYEYDTSSKDWIELYFWNRKL